MAECPRCKQTVKSEAIACPYCRTPLKAHGHPGIPLYRANGTDWLCKTCAYDADDSCNYPQRPFAQACTMYRDVRVAIASPTASSETISPRVWMRKNLVWIVLAGLILICFWLAVVGR